ncbi:uncharacterized protein LOC126771460 [Nymphalis io]|uniref:uncharacterized protein LOC126771460 n=1 Tax=Inachis io TaxID=171585 RepID=UPI002169420B|nr:uncharacterized protein LOC126771460 [Nymphalis io]
MDALPIFQNIAWCKDNWSLPSITDQNKKLIHQCTTLAVIELTDNMEEIIEKSKAFPIPFPIETVRLEYLKTLRPIKRLQRNITSTYPLIHERVLILLAKFLNYKREFGSDIEKALYNDMTVPELIDRILKKRALCFVGPHDKYRLLNGEKGTGGWEEIGTSKEKPPLILENCLSYDEMKISSMVYVSGYTECINNGTRCNNGVVSNDAEEEAIIIGLIGPRFVRRGKMDYEDILITKEQNCPENGYGEREARNDSKMLKADPTTQSIQSKQALREMWAEFYGTDTLVYSESFFKDVKNKTDQSTARYQHVIKGKKINCIFDNEVYYKRIVVLAEATLIEAEARAKGSGKNAFVNVIGCGLGIWMISKHQTDAYIVTFLERMTAFLKKDMLNHVTDVNFGYIKCGPDTEAIFKDRREKGVKKLFLKSETHPKGGISVQLENREPSSRLVGEHAGKLLVLTYPWDSNAHPGNEFWYGKLHTSGDPAAACSTQVSELHNAHVNPAVSAANARVAGGCRLKTLSDYCLALTA